jgi:hypothetical protein
LVQSSTATAPKIPETNHELWLTQTPSSSAGKPLSPSQRKARLNTVTDQVTEFVQFAHKSKSDSIAGYRFREKETALRILLQTLVGDVGEQLRSVAKQLDDVKGSLSLSWQAKFAVWLLGQKAEFYDKPGFWSHLVSEIGLSAQQKSSLRDLSRQLSATQEKESLRKCKADIEKVRSLVCEHLLRVNKPLHNLQQQLSTIQMAKLFAWVNNNEWCKQMAQDLWEEPKKPSSTDSTKKPVFKAPHTPEYRRSRKANCPAVSSSSSSSTQHVQK